MFTRTWSFIVGSSLIGAWLLASPAPGEERPSAAEWLKRFDASHDGKLDEAELARALADGATDPLRFVRIVKSPQGTPDALETSIVRFQSDDGQTHVDLVGAIHVGDESYYRELNRRFQAYEAVLYELIAPEGTRVPAQGVKSTHPVGRMQQAIKSMLALSFQLDVINYQAANFVHADLSPEEFAASMEKRGESFLQILFRMMGQAASQPARANGSQDIDLLKAFFAPDRPLQLKRALAGQFEDLEQQMQLFEGPNGSTLITERNKRALEVLRKQLDQGRQNVAIFYGAGHLPDMAQRLTQDFHLHPVDTQWISAWNLQAPRKDR